MQFEIPRKILTGGWVVSLRSNLTGMRVQHNLYYNIILFVDFEYSRAAIIYIIRMHVASSRFYIYNKILYCTQYVRRRYC